MASHFLKTASHEMSETLDGIVEADETYFSPSHKGKHDDEQEPRKRERIKGRGLSHNVVGVLVAVDRLGGVIDGILDNSSTSAIANVLKNRITPRSKLYIDGGSALWGFASKYDFSFATMPSGRYVCEYEPIFHIQTVNAYHSRLKRWIQRFRGVATKYLHSYLGWFRRFERSTFCISDVGWLQNFIVTLWEGQNPQL